MQDDPAFEAELERETAELLEAEFGHCEPLPSQKETKVVEKTKTPSKPAAQEGKTRSSQPQQVSSGKLTPRENIFRNSLRASEVAKPNPEEAAAPKKDPFAAFDVVLDPGSEQELKKKPDDKENSAKKVKVTDYLGAASEKKGKKRTVSEMT